MSQSTHAVIHEGFEILPGMLQWLVYEAPSYIVCAHLVAKTVGFVQDFDQHLSASKSSEAFYFKALLYYIKIHYYMSYFSLCQEVTGCRQME